MTSWRCCHVWLFWLLQFFVEGQLCEFCWSFCCRVTCCIEWCLLFFLLWCGDSNFTPLFTGLFQPVDVFLKSKLFWDTCCLRCLILCSFSLVKCTSMSWSSTRVVTHCHCYWFHWWQGAVLLFHVCKWITLISFTTLLKLCKVSKIWMGVKRQVLHTSVWRKKDCHCLRIVLSAFILFVCVCILQWTWIGYWCKSSVFKLNLSFQLHSHHEQVYSFSFCFWFLLYLLKFFFHVHQLWFDLELVITLLWFPFIPKY